MHSTKNEKPNMEEKSAKRTITKKDVSKRTAIIIGDKISSTEKIVDGVFQAIRDFISEANPEVRIEIRGFGVFEVKKTKAKPKARNPRTGEIIFVPAHRKTHFRAGKLLQDVLKIPLDEL
jgi:integration host factor subunit beta